MYRELLHPPQHTSPSTHHPSSSIASYLNPDKPFLWCFHYKTAVISEKEYHRVPVTMVIQCFFFFFEVTWASKWYHSTAHSYEYCNHSHHAIFMLYIKVPWYYPLISSLYHGTTIICVWKYFTSVYLSNKSLYS